MRTPESSSVLISVIICTHNRSDLLAGVLETLSNQTLDESDYEIIIVDNNSTDDTRDVAQRFCSCCRNMTYSFEEQQGLSHARNRGWREAKGEYVAYIDDDCKVPEQWLAVAKDIIERFSPGVFGGPAYAFYNTPKPYWFKDSYGSHEPFKDARILKNKECIQIFGMNMCFRRALLETIGGFDIRLGMCGEQIAYCEETALILHISNTMTDELIYYDPELYVYHLVQQERMSVVWFAKATISLGRYSIFCSEMDLPLTADRLMLSKMLLKQLILIAQEIARGVLKRDRERYRYFQNYVFERMKSHLYKFGKLYEHFVQLKAR